MLPKFLPGNNKVPNNPEKVLASSFTSLGGSHTSETADTLVGGLSQCFWTQTQLLGCFGYFVIENWEQPTPAPPIKRRSTKH